MGGHKNTPTKNIFCENETQSLLIRYVSQDSKDSFCDNDIPSLLTVDVSQYDQNSFCADESRDLLQLPQLLSTFNYVDHIDNDKKLLLLLILERPP